MIPLAAAAIVGAAIGWGALAVARELASARAEAASARRLQILTAFAPALAAADADPKSLLVWQPLAAAARQLFPADFQAIDRASGALFPFTPEKVQAAHARWTADWLAWERSHDADCKLKAAVVEQEMAAAGSSPAARAKLEEIEREKLERYQRRYEEYVRVAKALQKLA